MTTPAGASRQRVIDLVNSRDTHRMKHYVLMRYGLGWSLMEAFWGSWHQRNEPLSPGDVEYLMAHWNDPTADPETFAKATT